MTYDNTDTNADGAIDAPVDNQTVTTEKETITNQNTIYVIGGGGLYTKSYAIGDYSDFGDAVNNAIENGVRLILPKYTGDYSTTIDLRGYGGYILEGQGRYATYPKYTGSSEAIFAGNGNDWSLKDFTIRGDGNANSVGISIEADGNQGAGEAREYCIDSVKILGFDDGIVENEKNGGAIFMVGYSNISMGDIGNRGYNGTVSAQITFENIRAVNTNDLSNKIGYSTKFNGGIDETFMYIAANGVSLENVTASPECNGSNGIWLDGNNSVSLTNCHFEKAGDTNMLRVRGATRVSVDTCQFIDAPRHAINPEDDYTGLKITNCNFTNTSNNDVNFSSGSGEDNVTMYGNDINSGINNAQIPELFLSKNRITYETLSSDPTTSELAEGRCMVYVSDGSAGATGDDGDVILAINSGGTVKTTTLADYSAL